MRGRIEVDWTRTDSSFDLKVSIPAGTEADLALPTFGQSHVQISEGGQPVWAADAYVRGDRGVLDALKTSDSILIHIESGAYQFSMTGKPLRASGS
jgi:hypothetical protein